MTPTADIEVIGTRTSIALTALLDTGFDGHVCLPTDMAVTLGLQLASRQWVEYADGRRERELVFAGEVRFLSDVVPVEIVLTEGDDALVGTDLLDNKTLFIDFTTGEIRIQPSPGQSPASSL